MKKSEIEEFLKLFDAKTYDGLIGIITKELSDEEHMIHEIGLDDIHVLEESLVLREEVESRVYKDGEATEEMETSIYRTLIPIKEIIRITDNY